MNALCKIFLSIVVVVTAITWLLTVALGTSAIHQILAGIYALIVVISVAALGLNQALENVAGRLPKPRSAPPPA